MKNNIKILIGKNEDAIGQIAASIILGELYHKKNLVLGLATGSSPETMYEALNLDYARSGTD
jgi:6-phosphogluconolactonase/glucosamine-6-phosphate isomerase/deaminase